MTIGIIGSGNVAWHLIHGFELSNEVSIAWIYSRNQVALSDFSRFKTLPTIQSINESPVDLILVCVNDDAIEKVIHQLPEKSAIAYTSGTVSLENIAVEQNKIGVFYPLQTFTKGKAINLKNVPFLIESKDEGFRQMLIQLATLLSDNVSEMTSDQRKELHIAAVFTNNFVNHLLLVAKEQLEKYNLDGKLLEPLLIETIKKAIELGPYDAQSGPARRMDEQTIKEHLQELNGTPKEIYALLSESIKNTYKK